jgi:hypothetical protein
MFLMWVFTPNKVMQVLTVDKTVPTKSYREHKCFTWVLTHKKYKQSRTRYYKYAKDYMGFFPMKKKKYLVKDLKNFSEKQIDSLSKALHMVYYTDTYGVYYNEWYVDTTSTEHSKLLYGGLDKKDFLLLKKMHARKKLIVAEFNFFATPTRKSVQTRVEDLLHLKWSGWVGRYFDSFDTIENKELPKWLVRLYKEQHNNQWPFQKYHGGIAFVHEDERVEIVEDQVDLTYNYPEIITFPYGQKKFEVPRKLNFIYWFDITHSTDTSNRVFAYYKINTNRRGDSILKLQGIPKIFPAAYEHLQGSPYYYFCGDFCDNPVNYKFVIFKGIRYFELFILSPEDTNFGMIFFWRYYYPLMKRILKDYYATIPKVSKVQKTSGKTKVEPKKKSGKEGKQTGKKAPPEKKN